MVHCPRVRVRGRATSVSWIPSESVRGWLKGGFDVHLSHYDRPPTDSVGAGDEVDRLCADDRFRFGNVLSGWADFGDRTTAGYAEDSRLLMGSTRVRVGVGTMTFLGYALPTIQHPPVVEEDRVTLVQTAGGRTGVPLPRPVKHAALGPLARTDRVDDAHPRPAPRRHRRVRPDRGQRLPAALAVRRRRVPPPQVGDDAAEGLDGPLVRAADPLGRPGRRDRDRRGRVRHRAGPVGADHGRGRAAARRARCRGRRRPAPGPAGHDDLARPRRRPRRLRRRRARRRAGTRRRRSGSGRRSRAVAGPRRSSPAPPVAPRVRPGRAARPHRASPTSPSCTGERTRA